VNKTPIIAIGILALAFIALSYLDNSGKIILDEKPNECVTLQDCEGLLHIECEGNWQCENNKCLWVCQIEEPIGECSKDSDCIITGCSNHVCASESVVTTCEVREEYNCTKLTSCGCFEGACMWEKTDEYVSCLDKYR